MFGKEKMSRTQAFEWLSKFRNGLTSLHNAKCSVCPSTHKVDECDAYQGTCLQKHACLEVAVSFGLCWSILTQDMNMQLTDCCESCISYSNFWAELCCCLVGLAENILALAHILYEHSHRCQNWSWCWREEDFMAVSWFRNSQKMHLQSSEHRTSANASNSGVIAELFPSSDRGG